MGPRCPTQLRVFLLTLTVFDDIVAVAIIGVAYSGSLDPAALAVAAACMAALAVLSARAEWRAAPYVLIGLVLWVATYESGLHPSIAGMLRGPAGETQADPPVTGRHAAEIAAAREVASRRWKL